MKFDAETLRITESGKFGTTALTVGVVGLLLSALGWIINAETFFQSYLSAFFFWLSIGLGGLFFVMLHHLTSASWSVVLRRLSENVMSMLPLMILFFIPLLFGIHELYHWSHADVVAHNEILQKKAGYLNVPFFMIRAAIYFIAWIVLARLLYKSSTGQDNGDDGSFYPKFKKISAPGMLVFAFTLTFAGFDWLMSLKPEWYSTIFGVYLFAGSFLGILAFLVLFTQYLQSNGGLQDAVTVEHYHDLGKYLFGFTIFWAYIGFSQFMLIWYGNILEETLWYKARWFGTWKYISLLILFGHFIVPFLWLVTRGAKRNLKVLAGAAFWILLMHWVDIYWMVRPTFSQNIHFSWMDITSTVGIGGIFLWFLWKKMGARPLVPVGDPYLEKSIEFTNV